MNIRSWFWCRAEHLALWVLARPSHRVHSCAWSKGNVVRIVPQVQRYGGLN